MIKINVSGSHVQLVKPMGEGAELYLDSEDFTDELDAEAAVKLLETALAESQVRHRVERGASDD